MKDWKAVIGYMKKMTTKNPGNPEQIVDLISNAFITFVEKN
jgi:hypothetical protein